MPSKHERRRREEPRAIEGSNALQRELERREPGVSLEFFGHFHHPLNLQVIPQIAENLEELMAEAKGERRLYTTYAF